MKKVLFILLIIATVSLICIGVNRYNDWTFRFKSELDSFFGEGNWEKIDEEEEESIIFTEYHHVRRNAELDYETPGKYKKWYISYTDKYGRKGICEITDHSLKINNDKHVIFSEKRLSAKQALVSELMDISMAEASEKVYKEIIEPNFLKEVAEAINVEISYNGGNPKKDFYDKLNEEEWFNVNDSTAKRYLENNLHDFYLYIRTYDYRIAKMTDEQKVDLYNGYDKIISNLLEKYGEEASFKIYFDAEHKVEYINGVKQ